MDHVIWLGGGCGSGKSSIARELAHPQPLRRRLRDREPAPREREVDGLPLPEDRLLPAHGRDDVKEQGLRRPERLLVIRERLIELEHREFGIVLR